MSKRVQNIQKHYGKGTGRNNTSHLLALKKKTKPSEGKKKTNQKKGLLASQDMIWGGPGPMAGRGGSLERPRKT